MVLTVLKIKEPENNTGGSAIENNTKPIQAGKSLTSLQYAETESVIDNSAKVADFFKIPGEYRALYLLPNTGRVLRHNAPAIRPVENNISIGLYNNIIWN